ncbi:heparin lyase I family protein [Azospirillum halopraeferens]|uniref:heparin lyase I family protein n=1 Tax=Azospirillum halopraeferens TaxID=34010 RepID=UPI0003FBB796|nr:heparin lyase I family protein [Azospirillum halopraeferens]
MSNTGLLFNANFNSGSDITSMGFKYSGNPSSIVNIGGERAVKLTLDHYGSNTHKHRTEIQPNKLPGGDFSSGMFAKMGGEFWYGVRTYMPDSWNEPDRSVSIITQWHARPDAGNPPVALQTRMVNGKEHYNLIIRSDPTSNGTKGFKNIDQFDLGPISGDINKWTDWVWRIKWAPDGKGFLQLYKDGKLVVDFKGGTCYVDSAGPYLKVGLYKFEWNNAKDTGADSRTIYVDDVRIADATGGYATVASPSSTAGQKAPPSAGTDTKAPSSPTAPVVGGDTDGTAGGGGGGGGGSSDGAKGADANVIHGTDGADRLNGTAGADVVSGGAGDDVLSGGGGADILYGNEGNDVLYGNKGNDILYGGQGDDTVYGGQDHDQLHGNQGNDVLYGNLGNDVLFGNQGDDVLFGGQGDDVLFGGQGNDALYGGEGDDVLVGGLGFDTMTGGGGRDTFVIESFTDSMVRVTDFNPGEDRLDLAPLGASFRAATGQELTAEYLAFVQAGAATEIRLDLDGAGPLAAQTVAILDNVMASSLQFGETVFLEPQATFDHIG